MRNTLSTIRWMAEIRGAKGISQAINSFIHQIDYNMKYEEALASVREEVGYIQEYIYLQKLRYQNKFDLSFSIAEEHMSCLMPRFSLQPIVENSILHGLANMRGYGHITIATEVVDHDLFVRVSDDGSGIEECVLADLRRRTSEGGAPYSEANGIGLANIQQRMTWQFGTEYGLSIDSRVGEGTIVTMRLPLMKKADDEERM